MALTTVKSIETAINLIDAKKDDLKKAFEELQSRSSSLSSFTITWPDLDSYFTSLQSDLLLNFSNLQKTIEFQKSGPEKQKNASIVQLEPARPELKSFCRNMDGLGLRKYVIDRAKEMNAIRVELADALRLAPNPGSMVLDAMEGFCDRKNQLQPQLRKVCMVLLEEFMRSGMEVVAEVQERARVLAAEWEGKLLAINGDADEKGEKGGMERLGYLQLFASYKLFSDGARDVNKLLDYVVSIAKYQQAINLCRGLCIQRSVPDIIQRLIMKEKQLLALKFIFEFELTDKFPPVPLLKAFIQDSRKNARNVRKDGKNSRQALNEAGVKEINAMRSVIKCVKDYGLESPYPIKDLESRIEMLEKEQANRKKPGAIPVLKPQQQTKDSKQNGKKRMKPASGPLTVQRKFPPRSTSHLSPANRAGLHTGPAVQYLDRPGGPYGRVGAPYVGTSVPYTYPSETHPQPVHYERAVGYAGYEVPAQYHQVYYPQ